jgi:hypothetical protein
MNASGIFDPANLSTAPLALVEHLSEYARKGLNFSSKCRHFSLQLVDLRLNGLNARIEYIHLKSHVSKPHPDESWNVIDHIGEADYALLDWIRCHSLPPSAITVLRPEDRTTFI